MIDLSCTTITNMADKKAGFTKLLLALALLVTLTLVPGLAFAGEGDAQISAQSSEQIKAKASTNTEAISAQSSEKASAGAPGNANSASKQEAATGESENTDANAGISISAQSTENKTANTSTPAISAQSTNKSAPTISAQAAQPELVISKPSTITFGTNANTKFTFSVKNAPANSKISYRVDYLQVREFGFEGSFVAEADTAKRGFSTANSFTYNFRAAGTYTLGVTAKIGSLEIPVNIKFDVGDPIKDTNKTANYYATQIANEAMKAYSNTYDRVRYVHDRLIAKSSLASAGIHTGMSGVLLYGQGTSESFNSAMVHILMHKMRIQGVSTATDGNKTWTMVKFGSDGWTHIDVAADRELKNKPDLKYLYFGVTDSQMKSARPNFVPVSSRAAKNQKLNYYWRTGKMSKWVDPVKADISKKISNKDAAQNTYPPAKFPIQSVDDVYNIICPNVASYLNGTTIKGKQVFVKFNNRGPAKYSSSRFEWSRNDLTSTRCVVTGIKASYTCNGVAIQPVPTVKINGVTLKQGVDYTVSYSRNIQPNNNAMVIIKGIGKCSGQTVKTFKIVGKPNYAPTVTGTWKKSGGKWWFSYDAKTKKIHNGNKWPADQWVTIKGKRYHFDSSGWMHSKWQKLSDKKWYWLGSDGAMRTGWAKVSGKWYYLDPSTGAMQTGWKKVGNKYYYMNSSGAMKTGWLKLGTKWYYLNNSGARVTGWVKSSGKWYYMDPKENGAMMTSKLAQINKKWYYIAYDGTMQTGWKQVLGDWYYFYKSGARAQNAWVGNYWLGEDGVMAKNSWVDKGKYYVGNTGKWVPGKKK